MRAALELLMIVGFAAAAGCRKEPPQDQNIVITENIPANADIEALPPDESAGTPADQLENGSDNADVSDFNASANSF